MPTILNVRTGLTHAIAQWMWDEVWKTRVEKEPHNYRLVVSPILRTVKEKPVLRSDVKIAEAAPVPPKQDSMFDETVPKEMRFEYIEDLVKKSVVQPTAKPVIAKPAVKKRGRPPKRK